MIQAHRRYQVFVWRVLCPHSCPDPAPSASSPPALPSSRAAPHSLYSTGLRCSSCSPRPGQARGRCRGSLMPGVFFSQILRPSRGGGLVQCHLLRWAFPAVCTPAVTLSLFSVPLKAGTAVLVTRHLQAAWRSGCSFSERVSHASRFDLAAIQPREICKAPTF